MNRHFKPLVKWWNDPYNNMKGGELTLNLFKVTDLLLPLENYTLNVQPGLSAVSSKSRHG